MTNPDLLLPEGSRLLHIGPAKTGTTSLQSGFHHNREQLAPFGVHYAGKGSQPRAAAGFIATGKRVAGHKQGLEAWPDLVAEVNGSDAKRIVISSETFARAADDGARTAIEALGADRTHVVITMRPLVDMLASSWQQYVQVGRRKTWTGWLKEMLNSQDTLHGAQPEFWRKTRIDALAKRWGELVGMDHVTVVSLGGAPRDYVLRTFERFTGLPEGLLVPDPGFENVSLGLPVADVIRRFNELYLAETDGDMDVQARVVEFGAIRHLRQTPEVLRLDGRIEVPQWAADRAALIMHEMIDGIAELGVRTVGDLPALLVPSRPPVESVPEPRTVSVEAAAGLLFGMMQAARSQGLDAKSARESALAGLPALTTRDLVTQTGLRIASRVKGRLGR